MADWRIFRGLAWATSIVLVLAVGWQAIAGGTINDPPGGACAYLDGRNYCAMANGQPAQQPFASRVLVPGLARLLHVGGLAARFRLFDLGFLVLAVVAGAFLARRIAIVLGADQRRAMYAAVTAGALIGLAPHAFRYALSVPVMTDIAASALGLAWFALLASGDTRARWVSIAAAAAAVLAREQWALPILIVSVAAICWPKANRRPVGAATVLATVAALGFVLTRPTIGNSENGLDQWRHYLDVTTSAHGVVSYLLNVGFAVGLVPLCLLAVARPLSRRRDPEAGFLVGGALLTGLIPLGLAVFSGYDVARIAANGTSMLIALTLGVVAALGSDAILVALTAGTIILWRPWVALDGNVEQNWRLYAPHGVASGLRSTASWTAVAVVVVAATYGLARAAQRRTHPNLT